MAETGATTNGAAASAASAASVALGCVAIATAWNVQGDASDAGFAGSVRETLGVALPAAANTTARGGGWTALWIGPRSWLLVGDPAATAGGADRLAPTTSDFANRRDALIAAGGALFDVSASRVGFSVAGAGALAVLARSCPLDLHPQVFPAGACAQSLLGHVGALLYKRDDAPTFIVLVARSLGADAWHTLTGAARDVGYDADPRVSFTPAA